MEVNTRGGSFGPGGYGGGVFDGSMQISGVGGIGLEGHGDAYGLRSTASMAYHDGSLGTLPDATGLRSTASPAYRDGSLGNNEQAGAPIGDCYGYHFHAPPVAGLGGPTDILPWGEFDQRTQELQSALNIYLRRAGYDALETDGQLGPRTCGATSWIGTIDPSTVAWEGGGMQYLQYLSDVEGPACETFTFPKSGGEVFVPPSTREAAGLPWGTRSATTEEVQVALNEALVGHGYNTITVTGVLDATTCGAMRLAAREWGLDWHSEYGGNCEAFVEPTRLAPATTASIEPVAPIDPVLPPSVNGGGVSTAAVVGGILGVAALGALYYTSRS